MVGAGAEAPRESVRELWDEEVRAARRAAYGQVTACLPGESAPDPRPLALARRTLEGLLETPLPARWDDEEAVLKGTGRVGLSAGERAELGAAADRFPLLG